MFVKLVVLKVNKQAIVQQLGYICKRRDAVIKS